MPGSSWSAGKQTHIGFMPTPFALSDGHIHLSHIADIGASHAHLYYSRRSCRRSWRAPIRERYFILALPPAIAPTLKATDGLGNGYGLGVAVTHQAASGTV